jgi:hypothetical protein
MNHLDPTGLNCPKFLQNEIILGWLKPANQPPSPSKCLDNPASGTAFFLAAA